MSRKFRNNALLACGFIVIGIVTMFITENRIRDMHRLRETGIAVEARVVDMESRSGGRNGNTTYWLHTAVSGENSATPRELHVSVARADYKRLSVGTEVSLLYDSQNIENVELHEAVERWDADAFRQDRSRLTVNITVVLLGVIFLFRAAEAFVDWRNRS